MNYTTLEIEQTDRVAWVWMNRPERHNAFDQTLIEELSRAFRQLDDDAATRVVVLAGRGKSFSAGADLEWMRQAAGYSMEQNLRDARALADMLKTLRRMRKPTLARVHGTAIGGGVGLMAACDIALASTQAAFAMSEVRLGLIPSTIGPYVIEAIGARQAQRYFLTGERFDAVEACRIGLAHEACLPEHLDQRVEAITASLLGGGPCAQDAAKRLIADLAHAAIGEALIDDTAQRIARLRASDEAREGVGAFLDKRAASWVASAS